jgi:phosphate starvation-inducible PhoH-like protein
MKKHKKVAGSEEKNSTPKDPSEYVPQRDKIDFTLQIRDLNWTEKQKAFFEIATEKNTKIIFLSGPAGTSKSVLSVYSALQLLNAKRASEIVYVRSVVESASLSLGSLPGEAHDKFKPFAMPLIDKLEELLPTGDIKRLFTSERIKPTPVNYLRGASYNANVVIVDEAQNLTIQELITTITRIGKFSKFFILGDPMQTDLKNREQSGFKPLFDVFNDEESKSNGIHCVEFSKEDIMRSELLKFIVDRIDKYQSDKSKKH